jgi:hypothetical protein
MEGKRPWRLGVFFGNRLVPLHAEVSWEEKKVRFLHPRLLFQENGVYEAVLIDPTYRYTLIRAYLKPLEIRRSPAENSVILEMVCEFFHRKRKL